MTDAVVDTLLREVEHYGDAVIDGYHALRQLRKSQHRYVMDDDGRVTRHEAVDGSVYKERKYAIGHSIVEANHRIALLLGELRRVVYEHGGQFAFAEPITLRLVDLAMKDDVLTSKEEWNLPAVKEWLEHEASLGRFVLNTSFRGVSRRALVPADGGLSQWKATVSQPVLRRVLQLLYGLSERDLHFIGVVMEPVDDYLSEDELETQLRDKSDESATAASPVDAVVAVTVGMGPRLPNVSQQLSFVVMRNS